jgi:transposase
MRGEKYYLMSQTQLNRFHIISIVIDKKMTNSEAAVSLGLSIRQIIRLKKGVMKEGPDFLIHKNKDRKPVHAFSENFKERIIVLKKSNKYLNANFLHFKELLQDHEGLIVSYTALHDILTYAGIKSPKKHRKVNYHHRRKRKPKEGMLIQMDTTPFEWFGTEKKYALHGAIDDATGKIVGLYMSNTECLQGYFEVTRQLVNNFGIPISIYADRHTIFRSPKADKLSIEDQLLGKTANDTQFGRVLKEMGINLIAARSPQAKGRVERLWNTLQSRLPVEFSLAGINNIKQANNFLASYITKFNEKFSVVSSEIVSAFRPVPDNLEIDNILCVIQERIIDNGAVFSFYNKHYQVLCKEHLASIPVKTKVKVLISPVFGIKVQYQSNYYEVIPFVKHKKISRVAKTKSNKKKYIPPANHYYKYGKESCTKLSFEDSDRDILRMLEKIFLTKYA